MGITIVCRDVIRILGDYLNPMMAQLYLEKYCEEVGPSIDDFSYDDLPRLILHISSNREELDKLNDVRYTTMVTELIKLSNSVTSEENSEEHNQNESAQGVI